MKQYLTLSPNSASPAFGREADLPDAPVAPLPILLVEDDPQVCGMLELMLTELGYPVRSVCDRGGALAFLERDACALVITDQQLPDGTGLDLLRVVQRIQPAPPVILLSGSPDLDLPGRSLAQGAVEFLPKPVSFTLLARTLQQTWIRVERERTLAAARDRSLLAGAVRALVAAVDAKDPHTARHSERVTELSLLLGARMGLTYERLQLLELAALVHDVGKIGVPDQILCKPGRLDDAEWQVIREHPVRSAEIVRHMGTRSEIATVVRHHHERVDGTGYPDGLAGEAIPYLSRIIAVADVYEALTADRAYRRSWTPEQARNIIREGLDRHFDRAIGEAFLALDDLL